MQKKAIEVSLAFIVVIVIALSLFVLGVKFIYDITAEAGKIEEVSIEQLDRKFAELSCESNDKVCIGIIRREVPKGKFDVFGVKIINIISTTDFLVEVNPSSAFDKENNEIENNIRFKYNDKVILIEKNEEKNIGIAFEVPKEAQSGIYIFDIVVKYDMDGQFQQYDDAEKVYVEVT